MKMSVCVDAVYRDGAFAEGVRRALRAGFTAVEIWGWWDKDLEAAEQALKETGIELYAMCTRMISLVDERQRGAYLDGLVESIAVAGRLGCRRLVTQVGQELEGVPRERQRESLVAGLRACAPLLALHGMILLVEPLNTRVDHPGYFLAAADEAFAVLNEVGSEQVKLVYDIYHQQVTEGNILSTMEQNLSAIGHVHAAGCPGRGELDTGELDYIRIFRALAAMGYEGAVGLEYFPAGDPDAGLERLQALLGR
ncbi:TIM barrel protein [Paenibacillus athensensis]|uniref:Xylose isomerase-like TIM barrel domain-containing protein n=1 Tax=Paenibacillus athensensis TaxID=1967502 RepID=A0A4Y8PSX5_9BACL|nr:TIM barrel protein [Paenibacillus athensensis]MCD1258610.1 TIM barrel protein [Paenibacillus athensensis]